MSDLYTCAQCGETYAKVTHDVEANEEYHAIWGQARQEDDAIVCEDCFKEIMGRLMRGEIQRP